MKDIVRFIFQYARETDKRILSICTFFTAGLIWLNYSKDLEHRLATMSGLPSPYIAGHYILFLIAFLFPYSLLLARRKDKSHLKKGFIVCAIVAPFLFALKMGMDTNRIISADPYWNEYWNNILYWPLRLVMLFILIAFMKRFFSPDDSFYGLKPKRINWTPYLLMLLIMVPLLTIASTQPDFLATYPKLREVLPLPEGATPGWLYKLLFEISYGSDFVSIELFFRGFLVIGFMKWVGKDAILPMACFYCTIHFGKPLGECISSYFGGLLLGIVSYHTRSVYGGLMVHLGIAWLMEIGGYIGNLFNQ